jgi:hypothetical protein
LVAPSTMLRMVPLPRKRVRIKARSCLHNSQVGTGGALMLTRETGEEHGEIGAGVSRRRLEVLLRGEVVVGDVGG